MILFDRRAEALEVIIAASGEALEAIVHAIEEDAAANAPVDTGSLSDGYYIVTQHEDGYQDAAAAAMSLNPHVHILEHIDSYPDRLHAWVSNCTEHAVFVELGTVHMAAQPSLGPAVEAHTEDFADSVSTSIVAALRRF